MNYFFRFIKLNQSEPKWVFVLHLLNHGFNVLEMKRPGYENIHNSSPKWSQ